MQDIDPRIEICTRMAVDVPTMAPEAVSMPDCPQGGLGRPSDLRRFSGIDRVQTVRLDLGPIWESRLGNRIRQSAGTSLADLLLSLSE